MEILNRWNRIVVVATQITAILQVNRFNDDYWRDRISQHSQSVVDDILTLIIEHKEYWHPIGQLVIAFNGRAPCKHICLFATRSPGKDARRNS